ncbi:hypothetical protein [Pseudonocardia oroxyli]|uniref:Uncharacterized protein n=1 Tax=Pseudonocardia oroxyli TaxID=366584 RepID=A0A1G7XNM1_PSEOR|nr:hypothetical protein [Pseudonocardia oroxyli]SDG85711.1 hypothetical protein SAMN05216377_11637 [Pseudonocardia oroxyli]
MSEARDPRPDDPHHLEEKVDRLEEEVLGHRVDQDRHDGTDDTDVEGQPSADDAQGAAPGDEPTD